jgi:Ca2+-binding EF-hand superfamily protein
MAGKWSHPIPGAENDMSKKILLIAGVLLAAGSVAAISAPHFRGGHMRHGPLFGAFGDGGFGARPARFGEGLKEMDADKDGAVTLEEFLARRDPGFARFDQNKDGFVDAAEFEAAAKESTDYWVRRFIKRFDADNDGKVTKEEFAKARRERFARRDLDDDGSIGPEDMRPGARERLGRWFGDRARDRPSDRQDGKEAEPGKDGGKDRDVQGPGRFTLERLLDRAQRQFSRLDRNGDGFIDAKDFEARAADRKAHAARRFFKRFDTDGDGKVSRDEFNRLAKDRFANLDLDGDGKITEVDLPPTMRGRGILK